MKKILAWLLAWFTAFYNNVPYVEAPNSTGYQPGMYYKLETGESMPDYRENMQVTNQLDKKSVCLQTNYVAKRFDPTAESIRIDGKGDYAYWWQASTDSFPCDASAVDASASTVTLPAGSVIIAPSACLRTTGAQTKQPYPVTMTLEMTRNNVTYVVTITNMHCWACDAFRELDTVDGIPVIVHTYSDTSHNYSKGEVLGIAGENCQITVVKRNGASTAATSWKEFYNVQ